MKTIFLCFGIAFFLFSCVLNSKQNYASKCHSDSIYYSSDFVLVADIQGDLILDTSKERLLVFETPDTSDFGIDREIRLYSKEKSHWKLVDTFRGPILPSEHGGMMGNPFQGITIENRKIEINHFGGSRIKWSYTHLFSFQKDSFYLESCQINYGAPCDYWTNFSLSLNDNKVNYNSYSDDCEDEEYDDEREKFDIDTSFYITPQKIPMKDFYPGDNYLITSDSTISFFF